MIPFFDEIRNAAKNAGAYGTALSGAGPTVISIIPTAIEEAFISKMKELFPSLEIILTKADDQGISVTEVIEDVLA